MGTISIGEILLVNWVLLLSFAILDRKVFHDAIEHHAIAGTVFGLWSLVSVIAIPVWAVMWLVAKLSGTI